MRKNESKRKENDIPKYEPIKCVGKKYSKIMYSPDNFKTYCNGINGLLSEILISVLVPIVFEYAQLSNNEKNYKPIFECKILKEFILLSTFEHLNEIYAVYYNGDIGEIYIKKLINNILYGPFTHIRAIHTCKKYENTLYFLMRDSDMYFVNIDDILFTVDRKQINFHKYKTPSITPDLLCEGIIDMCRTSQYVALIYYPSFSHINRSYDASNEIYIFSPDVSDPQFIGNIEVPKKEGNIKKIEIMMDKLYVLMDNTIHMFNIEIENNTLKKTSYVPTIVVDRYYINRSGWFSDFFVINDIMFILMDSLRLVIIKLNTSQKTCDILYNNRNVYSKQYISEYGVYKSYDYLSFSYVVKYYMKKHE